MSALPKPWWSGIRRGFAPMFCVWNLPQNCLVRDFVGLKCLKGTVNVVLYQSYLSIWIFQNPKFELKFKKK